MSSDKISILESITQKSNHGKKQFAVLIDPDSISSETSLIEICELCNKSSVDLILVGGSLIINGFWDKAIEIIKKHTSIPLILFPGNIMQTHDNADAILFLSMISGRNPDLLIGKHVLAAPGLKKSGIEVIPTAYMIVDGGRLTSVMYMSNTTPIPHDKVNIAACTAMAGEMLGLKFIYMDAGSGANRPISAEMVKGVRDNTKAPIFIGGGIRSTKEAELICQAGADVIVVGNAIEKDKNLIAELANAIHSQNTGAQTI